MRVPGGIEKIAHARCVRILEGRPHEGAHLVHHGEFDRAHLENLGAERGHFEHFLEADLGEPPRLGFDARVGGVDAVDVGIDVAAVGLHGGGDRHGAGIRTAAPERGDAVVRAGALESRDHGHLSLAEALDQEGAVNLGDARRAMGVVGPDRDLPALPGPGMDAYRLQHERQQARRHLLAGRHHGVVFARVVDVEVRPFGLRGVADPTDQFVGLARHGRNHDRHLVARVHLAFDVPGHVADATDIGNRSSAEFHHDARHGSDMPLRGSRPLRPRKTNGCAPT